MGKRKTIIPKNKYIRDILIFKFSAAFLADIGETTAGQIFLFYIFWGRNSLPASASQQYILAFPINMQIFA
jgi:hypothetical protein